MNIFKRIINGVESENYYARFEHAGKGYLRSMDTPVKKEAERRAEKLLRQVKGARWGEVEATKVRSEMATVAEILDVYERCATDVKTRGQSANALRRMVERVLGRSAESVRASELTGELIHRYELSELAQVGQEYRRYEKSEARVRSDYSVRTTIRHNVASARAVFARDKMKYYAELQLPDLKGFLDARVQAPARRQPARPDEVGLARMLKALPELKEKQPAVYVAWLLMARLAMRPVEVRQARMGWVRVDDRGRRWMDIVARPEENFEAKGNEGSVQIADDVWAELVAARAASGVLGDAEADFVVPAGTMTDRRDLVERDLSGWVKGFLRGRGTTTSYALRRWAGSLILTATKSPVQTQRFLRHADIQTTLGWYATDLEETKPLTMAELAKASAGARTGVDQAAG